MPVEQINVAHPAARDRAASGIARDRDLRSALWRGARSRCPACGEHALYTRYLKVAESCGSCGEELHHHRADDAPPYFVILIVGHIIVGLVLAVEVAFQPALWVHALIWLPMILVLSLSLLPPIKGALVGLQWALRMHGFGDGGEDPHLDRNRLELVVRDEPTR